ncbi:MAG: 3-dehydroquinate synthase family protein [Tissierellia bacterium]|nr:3-dehydroquinate synthase family protein [Tissierellia bacterium]
MKAIINQIIDLKLSTNYQFILGEQIIENLYDHIGLRHDQKVLIISDEIVWKLYGMKIDNSFSSHNELVEKLIFDFGEKEKNIQNLFAILSCLAENSFRKTDLILAVGGGVICDLSALAASLYMRGIKHVLVPTTTLAAVDASVGGKTAINLDQGKNLVGTFKQPSRVVCDIDVFESLNDEVFYEGIAEAIKMAFINTPAMINLLDGDLRLDRARLYEVIGQSIKGKYHKIKNDEFDQNSRMELNFGHTLAHALEKLTSYELRHGQAVAIGMVFMVRLSEEKGYLEKRLPNKDLIRKYGDIRPSELLIEILKKNKLPYEYKFTYEEIEKYLSLDKKNRDDNTKLVMLDRLGSAFIKNVEFKNLKEFLGL